MPQSNTQSAQCQQLFQSLGKLMHNWHSLDPQGVSRSQFVVLSHLRHLQHCHTPQDNITVSMLAQDMDISVPAVSQTLKALEKDGYITRSTHPSDRRISYLSLSDKAEQMMSGNLKLLLRLTEKATAQRGVQVSTLIKSLDDMSELLKIIAKERNEC